MKYFYGLDDMDKAPSPVNRPTIWLRRCRSFIPQGLA